MPISNKQKQILAFPYTKYDALICDGSIRAGKTMFMVVAFIDWAMREFNNQRFGICAKTVDSASKNIVAPYLALTYWKYKYQVRWKRSEKLLIVRRGNTENVFEIFGGKDESSFALIQGRTLAGVLIDEVALQPRSFVEQALARCSVEGSKMWFNCNPESPQHWFYREWILKAKERNALHLHFTLEDNPSLSQKIIDRYKAMYTGVFYNRYILGEWVLAEGLIYAFDDERNRDNEAHNGLWYISVDYGIMNPFSAHLWCLQGGVAYCVDEYYYDGRESGRPRTDEEHYSEIESLAKGKNIEYIVIDPSASSMIETIYRHGRYDVRKAKNDVKGGIGAMGTLLQAGRLKYSDKCVNNIKEFGLYSWDADSGEDKPIKENDHAMDDNRYLVSTVLVDEFDWVDWSAYK